MPISAGRAMSARPGAGDPIQDKSKIAAKTEIKVVLFPARCAFISVTSKNLDIEIIEGDGEVGIADVPHPDKA